MATAMARTNPNRASVSIPTFIAEMKDFPETIRDLGRAALAIRKRKRPRGSTAAGHYLTYQFAIAPLISDVKKLLDFQNKVNSRCNELNRLNSKGGLKRRINLSDNSTSSRDTVTIESSLGSVIRTRRDTSTQAKRWATIRWKPVSSLDFPLEQQKRALAARLVGGLNPQSLTTTAWELIPWSWLTDWFLNVQNFLEAHANTVPVTTASKCVMTSWETKRTAVRADSITWVQGGDASGKTSDKHRYVAGPTLNSSLPFLNGGQLSILAALSINRVGR
jgi:hypothetical protein